MPRQTKKAEEIIITQEPNNNDAPDIYVQNALKQLGDTTAILQLYRVDKAGKFNYVDDLDPSNFSLKVIKTVYGGGHYKITVLDDKHHFHGRSKDFHIEGQSKAPIIEEDSYDYDDNDLSIPELTTLKNEITELKTIVASMIQQRPYQEAYQPHIDSEEQLLSKLLKYKQLFQPNDLTGNLEVLTGIFTKSLDFANRLGGNTEETPLTLLKDFLPTLTDWVGDYFELKKAEKYQSLTDEPLDKKPDLKDIIDKSFKVFLTNVLSMNTPIPKAIEFVTTKASNIEKDRIKELLNKQDASIYLCDLIGDKKASTKKYLDELIINLKEKLI